MSSGTAKSQYSSDPWERKGNRLGRKIWVKKKARRGPGPEGQHLMHGRAERNFEKTEGWKVRMKRPSKNPIGTVEDREITGVRGVGWRWGRIGVVLRWGGGSWWVGSKTVRKETKSILYTPRKR